MALTDCGIVLGTNQFGRSGFKITQQDGTTVDSDVGKEKEPIQPEESPAEPCTADTQPNEPGKTEIEPTPQEWSKESGVEQISLSRNLRLGPRETQGTCEW